MKTNLHLLDTAQTFYPTQCGQKEQISRPLEEVASSHSSSFLSEPLCAFMILIEM